MKLNILLKVLICLQMALGLSQNAFGAEPPEQSFSDESLQSLLAHSAENKTSGVIYSWSPRMPLSIRGVYELRTIAQKMGLEMQLVLDPSAVENEIQQSIAEFPLLAGTPRLKSSKLVAMSMMIHYPSLIIYKNGHLYPISRPGYDEPERVELYLKRVLK